MTVNELYKWIANPSMLTKFSLSELKQLMDEYPYFQAARMLYLKNLAMVEDIRFQKELKRMSIYLPDRKRLYMLIEGDKRKELSETENKSDITHLESGAAREDVQEQEPVAFQSKKNIKNQYITIPPSDYIHWLETNAEDITPEEGDNRLKHQDLIDSFLESDGKLQINKQENEKKIPEKEGEIISLNETVDKNVLDDSYFTETLARVYFSQKRYDKALEIIRVLNLKYPEKNIYFADQIRYLEKIINIKK